jgi:hypothetical protein
MFNEQDKIDYSNMIEKQKNKSFANFEVEKFIIDSFLYSIKDIKDIKDIKKSNSKSCNSSFKLDSSLKKRIINLYNHGVFPVKLGGLE